MLDGIHSAWQWAMLGLLALSVAIPLYAYVGYLPLLWLARVVRKAPKVEDLSDEALPDVVMVVAAFNEETVIARKVENFLALDYPPDRIRLLLGSDGSEDGTVKVAETAAGGNQRVTVVDFATRRGKAGVVNDLVAGSNAPIIVLSDANTMYESDAVRRLVRHFADPKVGAVCGKLVLTEEAGEVSREEGLYWKYETLLKTLESDAGCLSSINGQVFAFRRDLWKPLPTDLLTEDQYLGLGILTGGRLIRFEPEAVVTEPVGSLDVERARRLRISTGNFQTLFRAGLNLVNPLCGFPAFAYVSHKVLRWSVPFCMVAALAASVALIDIPAARWLLTAQVLFYGAATSPALLRPLARWPLFRLIHYLVVMNLTIGRGFLRYAFSRCEGTWQRTARA